MYQQFREVLYHGSVSEIVRVDVTRGRDKKDFGKGFYIAVSKSQAVGMMHKKQREAIRRGRNKNRVDIKEYLYEVKLDAEYAKNLDIKVFEQADEEWLEFNILLVAKRWQIV
jgi:5-formaminoimidazole-4-carboxamide-1-beta-D-ribofuranosyl 5'-monophosphate synthetase